MTKRSLISNIKRESQFSSKLKNHLIFISEPVTWWTSSYRGIKNILETSYLLKSTTNLFYRNSLNISDVRFLVFKNIFLRTIKLKHKENVLIEFRIVIMKFWFKFLSSIDFSEVALGKSMLYTTPILFTSKQK